ncbi:LptF/LptG family permease [Flavobacterium sp. RHBU_24]|uniref:LptF/LptG family permease n=1 Tax=Flavobacterium sp. RHBU_24 TaxID=3391185 RepID=UPI0039853CC5
MKILDRYILTSFIKTFGTVFIILFLIFVLQGIWLFIAELAGKDLDAWVIIKFLGFYSPTMVPLVLPLSILLASIMTFGSFAENYEFAAMKSSGISLGRAMRGLTIFIFCLSIVAFFFANNVIPQAQYRFSNLRKNIFQRKPAMAIVEGQFNAVGFFNIRVEKKSGENGEKLTGVTIHKRSPGAANATIIRSKTGLLKSQEKSNLLQLELYDGYYYEDINSKSPQDRLKKPFAKSSFSRQLMNIDLTALNNSDVDNEQISHTNNMLNVSELNYTLDSLEGSYDKEAKNIADNLVIRPVAAFTPTVAAAQNTVKDTLKKTKQPPKDLLAILKKADRPRVLEVAVNNVSSTQYIVTSGETVLQEKIKNINGHWLAFYDKFVIAYACIMMFFIGAPLGAIIRKGGLGLPIVFAVLIFIIFHFINTFGKKLAQENGIPPFMGSWVSSFVLTPLAILLTYRATNDIGLISFDNLLLPLQKVFEKLFKAKPKTQV